MNLKPWYKVFNQRVWIVTSSIEALMELINVDYIIRFKGKEMNGACAVLAEKIDGKEAIISNFKCAASEYSNCSDYTNVNGFIRLIEVLKPYDLSS